VAWHGEYFHLGYSQPLIIVNASISGKGRCVENLGSQYIMEDKEYGEKCWRCMTIFRKHQNVLQYRESKHLSHTANEGPVRIQYKCLGPFYVFPEMKLLFPKQNNNVLSQFLHSYICERFIYFQDHSVYSAAGKYVD
jgi:hypothetical protein